MPITSKVLYGSCGMCDLFKIMINRKEESTSTFVEHKVTHYQQRFNWDCGVTCVLMVLSTEQQRELSESLHDICAEEGFNQSTWTIDLCYLLKRYDIKHHMYTITTGVNEDYRKHGYYDKIIDIDRSRVRQRFARASAEGIRVTARPLPLRALVAHVCSRGPALVLVDSGLLVCDLCKRNKMKAELRRWFGGSYSGHYILVVGVSRGKLLYRDPARGAGACRDRSHGAGACRGAPAALERARRAHGTDHDVVLIYKDFR